MPKLLRRQTILAKGGLDIGAQGSTVSEMLFGTVDITCPSADASAIGVRTASIANLDAGAQIFFTAASLPVAFALVSACVEDVSGGEFSASFLNVSTADISTSAIATLQYMAIS